MDEIYFVRETEDKKITLKWNKPKDDLYKRFICDLSSLLEKYEFAFEEKVQKRDTPLCLSYAMPISGIKGFCCADEERPNCPCDGDYSKCKYKGVFNSNVVRN